MLLQWDRLWLYWGALRCTCEMPGKSFPPFQHIFGGFEVQLKNINIKMVTAKGWRSCFLSATDLQMVVKVSLR